MVSRGAEPANPDMSGRKMNEMPSVKRSSLTTGSITVGDVSVGNLDALDDLVSLDSDVGMSTGGSTKQQRQQRQQQQSSPEGQRSTRQLPDYNPIGLTIGDASSPQAIGSRHAHNAVHMHVQENAKVPGLNISVDRSNSSRPAYKGSEGMSSSTQREIEEIIKLGQNDRTNPSRSTAQTSDNSSVSMAELFLSKESSNRRSLDMNYDNFGTVLSDFGFGGDRTRSRSASMTSSNDAGSFRNASTAAAVSANHSRADVEDSTQMEIDALTAAIDPTPWSEIKEKIQKRVGHEEPRQKQRQRQGSEQIDQTSNQGNTKASNIIDTTIATNHPHHYSYYPYGRHHQLPIPEKVPSPPNRPMTSPNMTAVGMADAVATAAALASAGFAAPTRAVKKASSHGSPPHPDAVRRIANQTNGTTQESKAATTHMKSTSNGKSRDPSPIQSAPSQHTKHQQPPKDKTGIPSFSSNTSSRSDNTQSSVSPTRHFQRHRGPAYNPQHHAAAHATSRGSVMAATTQKSQYGFGGNHMVPSVPAPPPPMKGKSPPISHYRPTYPHSKPVIPNGNKAPPLLPPHHSSHSASPPPAYAGAAYERKKQRAKDARVKLNESIERLAVSMSLAGSQSKQRASVLIAKIQGVNESQPSIRAKTLQLLDECTKEAESAKKWDRPSFVGTAASLIQALNSQCDGLMRELVDLQEQLDDAKLNGPTSSQQATSPEAGIESSRSMVSMSHPESKRQAPPTTSHQDGGNDPAVMYPHKRMRAVHIDNVSDQSSTSRHSVEEIGARESQLQEPSHGMGETTDEQSVLALVSTMLDPISLCQCPCVSRSWRGIGAYQKDQSWLDLAVKRFGYYNVRQWTEKLQDSGQAARSSGEIHMKSLYRAMNVANVMPHMPQEGMLFLGDAKIPGRVSGWAFMVERSNGETLRSVKREPATLNSGEGSTASSRGGIGPFISLPVVELRIVIQNIGMASGPIILRDQSITVDTSTRRSGGELREIYWDERFAKVVQDCNGAVCERPGTKQAKYDMNNELCRLKLFETKILKVHIHARGCSTMSRFQQRSNFTKILVCLDGTTIPLVVPFLRDGNASQL